MLEYEEHTAKILADLQRISNLVHENSDAVNWALELMAIVFREYQQIREN